MSLTEMQQAKLRDYDRLVNELAACRSELERGGARLVNALGNEVHQNLDVTAALTACEERLAAAEAKIEKRQAFHEHAAESWKQEVADLEAVNEALRAVEKAARRVRGLVVSPYWTELDAALAALDEPDPPMTGYGPSGP